MSIWQQTEEQLASFSPLKRWGVTILAAVMTVAGVWFFWVEDVEAQIESAEARRTQLARQMRQVDIRRVSKKIERIKKERLASEEKLLKSRAAFGFLRTKLERVHKVRFDQKRLADLLDAILKRSVDLGIRVKSIQSAPKSGDLTPFLEAKREVRVEGGGDFADIVKLTYFIESLDMLAKLESVKISLDEDGRTVFDIYIETYGMKR